MKLIRSKTALTYNDRKKKNGIIAIRITSFSWNEQLKKYIIQVEDCEVKETGATAPGEPLKSYHPFNSEPRDRTQDQVNDLFNYFGVDIVQGDDFTGKFRDLIVKSLLLDTQQNPIYGSAPEDWEIIDTETEIAP